MWETALLEKKQRRYNEMLAILEDLTGLKNDYRIRAFEELAKHYEHRAKDIPQALHMTRSAERIGPSPELQHRQARLERRLAKEQKREPTLL